MDIGFGHRDTAAMSRPWQVSLGVKLMCAGAVLAVLDAVALPLQSDQLREYLGSFNAYSDHPGPRSVEIEIIEISTVLGVLFGVIWVSQWICLAVMNGRGETRARVIATVLGGLNIVVVAALLVASARLRSANEPAADDPAVLVLSSGARGVLLVLPLAGAVMGQIGTVLSLVRSLAGLVLSAAIIFLIWQPASSAYYASRSSPAASAHSPQPPVCRSPGSFWRTAVLWFPVLNCIAMLFVSMVTFGSGVAFLVAAALLALAELALLIARARRCGVGGLEVAVAMLANVGLSIILLFAPYALVL